MISLGVTRRNGQVGLYRRDHDLSGTEWTLLLPLDKASGIYLHDHGRLVNGNEEATSLGATPGIVILDDRIEARHALGQPKSVIATCSYYDCWAIADEAIKNPFIHRLFASTRPA